MKLYKKNQKGQVMLVSVLTLGGIMLSAASIAGLLMTYQIRAANDAVNSAKAFFAADAAIEAASYCYTKITCDDLPGFVSNLSFNSGVAASATFTLRLDSFDIFASGLASNGRVIRNLEASFALSTP